MSSPFECVKDCGRKFPTNVGLSVHRKKCKVSREVAKGNAAKLLEMKKRAKELELEEQRRKMELKELTRRSEKRQKTTHPLASEVRHEEEQEGHHVDLAFVGRLRASSDLQSARQATMPQPVASTSSTSGVCG